MNDDQEKQKKPFEPRDHLIQIKSGQRSNDYLPVYARLMWFREKFPNGSIETEMVHLDLECDTEEEVFVWSNEERKSKKVIKHAKGLAIFRATVKDGMGGIAVGTKMEKAASFADFLEKSETGAIGRALAALGFGTQFTDELDERHRIVDSPVARPTSTVHKSTPKPPMPAKESTPQVSLHQLIGQAKDRALASGAVTNAQEWKQMLSDLGIVEITNQDDLAAVNTFLSEGAQA